MESFGKPAVFAAATFALFPTPPKPVPSPRSDSSSFLAFPRSRASCSARFLSAARFVSVNCSSYCRPVTSRCASNAAAEPPAATNLAFRRPYTSCSLCIWRLRSLSSSLSCFISSTSGPCPCDAPPPDPGVALLPEPKVVDGVMGAPTMASARSLAIWRSTSCMRSSARTALRSSCAFRAVSSAAAAAAAAPLPELAPLKALLFMAASRRSSLPRSIASSSALATASSRMGSISCTVLSIAASSALALAASRLASSASRMCLSTSADPRSPVTANRVSSERARLLSSSSSSQSRAS
mmetsp:Transcript_5035/g.23178  ORF Transcript_5035/g.23178 Transcript_5035/m.23178 type:complete len:296 (-) Transcript_5035:1692-2579(-)